MMKTSRLLGQFLVLNEVVDIAQLNQALLYQKKTALNLSLMTRVEGLLMEKDLERVQMRQIEHLESFEEALIALGLFSEAELDELHGAKREFRVPLGEILIRQRMIERDQLNFWLERFHDQKFGIAELFVLLKKIPLFAQLEDNLLEEICSLLNFKYVLAGETIYSEGAESRGLYIIESGLVRMSIKSGTREMELGYLKPGDHFGLHSALSRLPQSERATTTMNTTLWRLECENLHMLIQNNPHLAVASARILSESMGNVFRNVHNRDGKVYGSNITSVIFNHDVKETKKIARNIVDELERFCTHETLLIYTTSVLDTPGLAPESLDTCDDLRLEENVTGNLLRAVCLSRLKQPVDPDKIAIWIHEMSNEFKSIVILVSVEFSKFIEFIPDICRRSAVFLQDDIPYFVSLLKPGRDRVYFMDAELRETNLLHHTQMLERNEDVLAPNLLKIDAVAAASQRIIRWLLGKSVGIAFGGGGARGMAHIGVLQILQKAGIIIDAVSGASAGAIVGGLLANGMSPLEMEDFFIKHAIRPRRHPLSDYGIPRVSLLRGKKAEKLLKLAFEDAYSFETGIPYFPVVTDMQSGKESVARNCPLWQAVLASGSAPGLLPPVFLHGRCLGDGGLVDNVPALVLKNFGVDFVISLNISIDPDKSKINSKSIIGIVLQSIDILMEQSMKHYLNFTNFEIRPELTEFGIFDYRSGPRIIELGREAARNKLPELLRILEKLNIPYGPPAG